MSTQSMASVLTAEYNRLRREKAIIVKTLTKSHRTDRIEGIKGKSERTEGLEKQLRSQLKSIRKMRF